MKVLKINEVADKLRVSVSHVRKCKSRPGFPQPLGYSQRPLLWSADAIKHYLDSLSKSSRAVDR